jgi:uncharacterized membrane protein
VVLDFDGTGTAEAEVLTQLHSMHKEHRVDLVDACVVVHIKELGAGVTGLKNSAPQHVPDRQETINGHTERR